MNLLFPQLIRLCNSVRKIGGAVVLSAVMIAFPIPAEWWGPTERIGFIANINLAEITDEKVSTFFNKNIEGSIGLAYKFSENFALPFTYEKVFNRRMRNHYLKNYTGGKIEIDGQTLTELNKENNSLLRVDNHNALSIKLVFTFK